jgi:hypothetical protein
LGVLLLGVPAAAAAASESAVPVDAGTGAPEPTAPAGAAPGTEPPTPAPSDAGGTDAAGPPTEPEPSPSPSPVEPEPPVAAPTPAADAPAPAPDQPDRFAGDSTEPGQEDPVGDDRGDAPSSGRDEPSAAPAAGSGPAVDDPGSTAEAPQPPPARLTAVGADAAPASDRTTAHGQRAAHTPVLIAPRRPDSAKPRTPVVRHGPQRGMAAPAPALFGQPVAAPATAAAAEIPQSPGVGSSRAGTRDHPPKHAAPHRAHGEPATPAPTTPPGGVVQAAASAAGGGSAAPELACILSATIVTSGTSALQRHRIALIVPAPSNCSSPLERPG